MKEFFNGIDRVEVVGMILALVFAGIAIVLVKLALNLMFIEADLASAGTIIGVVGIWIALSLFVCAGVAHRKANQRIEASFCEILGAIKRCECRCHGTVTCE